MKLLIVGTINNFCLETSYASAAKQLGHEVYRFDPAKESHEYIKFWKVGNKLHSFLPVETWTRKMNRKLIVYTKETMPDVILLFGTASILYGTLITIRLINPACKFVWVWPDTPMNLNNNNLNNAPLFDLSATYSASTIEAFNKIGFANTKWIALAGDQSLHWKPVPEGDDFDCDISFVGMWRPEREKIMKVIEQNFPSLKIEIYGNYWKRNCKDAALMKRWKGEGFYASQLADYFNRSRININVIDDTNYPAANMRFFEIPTSGGLELCSACPEFEKEFRDGEHLFYFKNETELVDKINSILKDKGRVQAVRKAGQRMIAEKHNYTERLKTILNSL